MRMFPHVAVVVAGCALLACSAPVSHAQVVEDVVVETYHVQPSTTPGEPPLTTYRIYIDLAEGCALQMVYGDAAHQMFIFTSTWFQNDPANGAKYADRIDSAMSLVPSDRLDSWLTIGAVSSRHIGVPLTIDPDGSVFICEEEATRDPLCDSDGMVAVANVKEVVNFHFDPGYLNEARGQLLETTDGAWAAFGGVKGATAENMVLIAQITTTGELSFRLNLQVTDPDRKVHKCVAGNAREGETLVPELVFGRDYHEFFR